MKEVFEKIRERLEEASFEVVVDDGYDGYDEYDHESADCVLLSEAIEIVNQVAEEYCKPKLTPEQRDACWAHSSKDCSKCGQCYVPEINVGENDSWIPCSEELPPQPKENPLFDNKPLELYLVSLNSTDYPWRAFWNGEFFTDGWSKVEPIAWQPLPEPYKPKGENNV